MKQRILSFTIVILLAAVATPAFAQVKVNVTGTASTTPIKVRAEVKANMEAKREEKMASSTERRTELKANVEERKAEMKTNAEARKASSTEKRIEMQRGLAKKKADHTARVLTATVERLEKIVVRIESRIAKLKAEGKATAESEGYIAEAKVHLSAAKTSIALFASVDLSGDKAQENFERVRAIAAEAKGHIREAHQSLMKAIRALGKPRVEANATSTATTTAQ